MEALQYIYTSWKNGDSTEKGYMIYSRSEGITDTECGAIKDAMQYLAPKELSLTPSAQEIADIFPYAFSYFVLPTGRGCVAQSTYLGKDYSGRYGNYIIYALVFDVDDLPCRPAELFAEPFMKTAMTDEELNAPSPVPPLPPLYISQYGSVINDDQLNEFLFDKEEEFAQLVTLILAARDAGVPFYLNDSRENLVLWSAAVQRILPPRLAKKFMFNTYIGDHESMRTPKAREKGLNFHLIGVRPDANYFNYATESNSNRHVVMDFLGSYMTQGIVPTGYAQAMASSITMDFEEIESFGEFVDSTSFNEISSRLQDAYLCYQLLRNDEFAFSEENLKAVLSFGTTYCSEYDNSEIGSKLLIKCQEEGWTLEKDLLVLFWNFVCKHTDFMMFTLFDFLTDTVYQHAGEAAGPCTELTELLQTLRDETPQRYKEYLDHLDTSGSVDHLLLYLTGHDNPHTNGFYITWLLENYVFVGGLNNRRPISALLLCLLRNITHIPGCEKQMIEILLATSNNQELFEDILNVFMNAFSDHTRLERLCAGYVEVTASLSDRQLERFERLMLETPGAAPIATRLCARKIAAAKDPEEEFWRFYTNQRARIVSNGGFAIEPMILACVNHVDAKDREAVAVDILKKIDAALITDSQTVMLLTDIVEGCSVKTLMKLDAGFLRRIGVLRAKAGKGGLEKMKAVYVGKMLEAGNAKSGRPVSLTEELSQNAVTLKQLEKSDYETYLKNFFGEYFPLLRGTGDVATLTKIFWHSRCFSDFVDDYISTVKKLEKKEEERWMRVLSWTCVYLVTAGRSDDAAEAMYKPVVRYLRSLDGDDLNDLRYAMAQEIPSARCDDLFEEVRRKEGFSEKLGNFFHKK